jgi:glutathione S-transferase
MQEPPVYILYHSPYSQHARRVPGADVLDGDIKLHESNAILRYLCSKHALSDWYPSAPRSWFERMLAIEGFPPLVA